MSKKRLTPEQRARIAARLKAGDRNKDIARDEGCTIASVTYIKTHGPLATSGPTPPRFPQKYKVHVLPPYDPTAPRMRCSKLNATLAVAACGTRSAMADSGDSRHTACRGCAIGQGNAAQLATPAAE